jgi:hypothetical protein
MLLLIGLAAQLRQGSNLNLPVIAEKGIMRSTWIYKANYIPVIKMVNNGDLPLQHGREYLQNGMVVIPRFLYPDKPLSFDYFLKKKLNLNFAGGGAPATTFASLYLNFYFIGVIMGMIIIGYAYCQFYHRYRNESNLTNTLIYMFILSYLLNPSLLLSNIVLLLLYVTFIKIVSRIALPIAPDPEIREKP